MVAVGRVIIDDRSHPAYVGADAHDAVQAHLVGVVAGLEALAARGDTAPLLLRLSDPAAAECVAGVWEPAAASRLRSQLLSLLNAARARRGHVWVAGYDEHRIHALGERATALAAFASMPRPGGLPRGWVPAAPPDPLWAGVVRSPPPPSTPAPAALGAGGVIADGFAEGARAPGSVVR